jgi:benzoyl-CoA-dihydrodiol lyase
LLGVLPGTGGLTRLVDKRKVRRDRADVFSTLAEGLKGKRAKEWGLIDDYFPTSKFQESIDARVDAIAGVKQTVSLRNDREALSLSDSDASQTNSLLYKDSGVVEH